MHFACRYGFNGKENDNEVKGVGNQQDYGMRIYDPRIGKFLSVDPLTKGYPMLTPYQFASNSPVKHKDIDGLEAGPDEALLWSRPDDPEVKQRFSKSPVGKGVQKASDVAGGFLNAFFMAVGAVTEIPAAGSYGDKVNKVEAFPLTQGDIGHTARGIVTAPVELAVALRNDPTNGELYGQGLFMLAPFAKGRSNIKAPFTEQASMALEMSNKARVFSAGGEIGILDGAGTLSVNANSGVLRGELLINDKSVFLEGKVSIDNGVLNIKDFGVRPKEGTYNSTDLVGEIGFAPFKKLMDEMTEIRKAGGYEKGNLEFFRLRPEGSKLPDSETRTIKF